MQARREIEQAFRVGGKVMERRVDVGQTVHEGDVLAVLDDVDYRLTEQATRQQLEAATARARQAESDAARLEALKLDGSVSESDEEHAQSELRTSRAAAEAEARRLALARNQVKYTVLTASSSGVVTSLQLEVGQVVAAGQPVIAIATEGEPEIVVDVPEAHLEAFKSARFSASLASAPDDAIRSRTAGAVSTGGRADPHLSRPPEAGDTSHPSARCDGDARRRARLVRPARCRDPGFRHNAAQGQAGIVDRAPHWR